MYSFPDYLGVVASKIARARGGGSPRGTFNRDIDEGNRILESVKAPSFLEAGAI